MFPRNSSVRPFVLPAPLVDRSALSKIPEPVLSIDLPVQQYKTTKIVPIPFDPRVCDGGLFNSLREAMLFIGRHCLFHHKSFNKTLARMYLPHSRILNLVKGGYVPPTHVSKRDFDAAFSAASRLLQSAH
jgi:hypothetical protein